jgi:O-antigen/teichoic acid export membrane protein
VNASEKLDPASVAARVKGAVLWRSGSQVVAQLITWAATFLVIRLLDPHDYGLFAMTQVVLVFLNLMNGYGFASALIQSESIDRERVRQVFGLLLLLNGGLALAQLVMAPVAAAYFRQPIVADMLYVQALLYASTPFAALAHALLGRGIDFKKQAHAHLIAAVLGALTALGLAYAGWGVWTLVAAPIVIFWARAIAVTIAARSLVWPSFRFKGAGEIVRFGGAMVLVQFFWFIQSQFDVFIAGRQLGAHDLGIYTTALFLTQILAAKFVPPLNEVAFAAYSRLQPHGDALPNAFLKAVRLIMLAALPFYFGLAATAEPLVLTVLGPKWTETIPIVPVLALAMPMMTLQILFAPATNATGRAGIALRASLAGAVIMPIAFLAGVRFGIAGLAWAWLGGMLLLMLATAALSLPAIGVRAGQLAAAIAPGLAASVAMAILVWSLAGLLPPMAPQVRLMLLVAAGVTIYAALLLAFARPIVDELLALVRKPPAAPAAG